MQNNIISWKPTSDLTLDKQLFQKMLLLIEGRLTKELFYVITDYWKVHISDEDTNIIGTDRKKQLPDGKFAYGHFSRGVDIGKVKGWMLESDLVDLYSDGDLSNVEKT